MENMKPCNKHRRIFMLLLSACIVLLLILHNIRIQGNNLQLKLRNREIWIKNLGKTVTNRPTTSLSRLLVDKLDHKAKEHSDPEVFVNTNRIINSRLSSSISYSKLADIAHNSYNILDVQVDTLLYVKKLMSSMSLGNNNTSKPNTYGNTSQPFNNVDITSKFAYEENNTEFKEASPSQSDNGSDNINDETDIGQFLQVEDENNEFDVTDLDDHITFPIRKPDNEPEKQLSDRKRMKWVQSNNTLNNSPEFRRSIYEANFRQVRNQAGIDCTEITDNKESAIMEAEQIMRDVQRRAIPVKKYANTVNCENFRGGRGYIEHPLSQMELDFPIAFAITAYKDVEQVERLLRAIYRPHNTYCFHLDIKMHQIERTAIEHISNCFDNVIITDKSVNVTWGEFTVLEAELLCMETLWQYKKWKYYINLTGQEFPLKTNREIVAILHALDGANLVDGTWIRAREKYFYRWTQAGDPPPHKIRPIKGSVHVAINRNFVDFALHDQRSLDFLEWLKKTQIPDETFFASLNHNPHLGINGSFLGEAEEYPLKPSLTRYKNWEIGHSVFVRRCAGKYVRNVCVLGVGDLHKAYNDIGLFANKFFLDFEYLALDCLEEILYQKTWDQYLNDVNIDTNYYQHLDYVSRKLVVPPKD